jgi:flagellin
MVMSMINNISSLNAQRSLVSASDKMGSAMSKLSSGMRITKAGDDAAGLAISEKLRGEIKGLNQATRNANDAISMVQTAEGALEEVHAMLQRIRELAVQASNDTLDDTDRGFISAEISELRDQINAVSNNTEFNGKKLANGALTTSLDAASSTLSLGEILGTAGVTSIDVGEANAATTFTFTNNLSSITLGDGSSSQTIAHSDMDVATDGTTVINFSELGISITVASALAEDGSDIGAALDTQTIVTDTGDGGATFQTGADAGQNITVNFRNVEIEGTNTDTRVTTLDTALDAFLGGTATRAEAEAIISAVDHTIQFISETRADYGSKQNRLEHTVNNLMQTSENLTASESRIRDVDVAFESANMAKATVLQQAAVSVLSQANQQPQLALKLLG